MLVRELAQLLSDNELTEIEVQDGERRIKVSREPAMMMGVPTAAAPQHLAAAALSAPPMHAKEDLVADAAEENAGHMVKSPMVGTAFLAPEPGSKPFVEVGTPEGRRHLVHRRGDEGNKSDHCAQGRSDHEDYGRRRSARRVRSAARDHRLIRRWRKSKSC